LAGNPITFDGLQAATVGLAGQLQKEEIAIHNAASFGQSDHAAERMLASDVTVLTVTPEPHELLELDVELRVASASLEGKAADVI
jgi:hypothetical protein